MVWSKTAMAAAVQRPVQGRLNKLKNLMCSWYIHDNQASAWLFAGFGHAFVQGNATE